MLILSETNAITRAVTQPIPQNIGVALLRAFALPLAGVLSSVFYAPPTQGQNIGFLGESGLSEQPSLTREGGLQKKSTGV